MSKLIRQTHRWLSIVFTVTVIANFVVLGLSHSRAVVRHRSAHGILASRSTSFPPIIFQP